MNETEELLMLLRGTFDALVELGERVAALEGKEDKSPELVELERRLARLEASDFAQNRRDYNAIMHDLERGMPGVPLYPE